MGDKDGRPSDTRWIVAVAALCSADDDNVQPSSTCNVRGLTGLGDNMALADAEPRSGVSAVRGTGAASVSLPRDAARSKRLCMLVTSSVCMARIQHQR